VRWEGGAVDGSHACLCLSRADEPFCSAGGFVMVYAPRDEAEVVVVLQIVKAAAWFVSGGDGVKDFFPDERRDSGYASAEEADAVES